MKKVGYIFLYPFSLLYGLGTGLRNILFDEKLFKSKQFDTVKIISIGNLCAGGTGKTPHIEYLIKILKQQFKLATLSRGYKRKTKGFVLANEKSTATDIGDEPLQFKTKNPSLAVAVDNKRVRGIQNLLEQNQLPEVILLDDAYQHRWVKPGLNILLTDYSKLYVNDTFLPSGRLRESKKGAQRADIIIVTKTPENVTNIEMRGIIKDLNLLAHQTVYFSYLKYNNLYNFFSPTETMQPALELFQYHALIVTGIANEQTLITYVKEYADEITHLKYQDHYEFTIGDVEVIKAKYEALPGKHKIIITTEKDAMRLKDNKIRSLLNGLPLFVLPVEVDFKNRTEEFNENILKYVRENKIYHKKYS